MIEKATEKRNNKGKIIILCGLLMVVFSYVSVTSTFVPWLFQLLVLCALCYALYIYIRFYMTDYVYEIKGKYLNVFKVMGKRQTTAAQIPVELILSVTKKGESYKKIKERSHVFNYCKTMFPKEYYVVYAHIEGDYTDTLKIECSDVFAEKLKKKV